MIREKKYKNFILKNIIFIVLYGTVGISCFSQAVNKNRKELIPDIINPSPDYYSTWQTQQYFTNDGGSALQRANLIEANIFGNGKCQSSINFYFKVRKDLFFVMDDSWDIPFSGDTKKYFRSLILNKQRFPSYAKKYVSNRHALKNLNEAVKRKGWKALGGWICAQESDSFLFGKTQTDYWIKRAKWANYAGFAYWKVDWGKHSYDYNFRKLLTDIAHQYAPNLIVEHARNDSIIPVRDVFRTYDVPAFLTIPMTMKQLKNTLTLYTSESKYKGLICAEDEVYIAAGLGCTIGIMRHPMAGNLTNGKPDPSFPAMHRNLKTKMDEVTRAVMWHKIAPAFGVNAAQTYIDSLNLTDSWQIQHMDEEIESWWFEPWTGLKKDENIIAETGPAAISRSMPLPIVTPDENGDNQFVVASKNPNGAVSITVAARTKDRKYWTPNCDISISSGDAKTFGIFGYYKSLTINTSLNLSRVTIEAQDLAGVQVIDISSKIIISQSKLIIPGKVITEIGKGEQSSGDTSEPGLVLVIANK